MVQSRKKLLSALILSLFLVSLFFPGYQGGIREAEDGNFLSCPGLLYLECLRSMTEGTGITRETSSRQFLQSQPRCGQRMLSLRAPDPYVNEAVRTKCFVPMALGVVCMMIFLTIIIYIFRKDGKKRVVKV